MKVEENTESTQERKGPSVLCLLDFAFGNMTIHYSRTRILHARQGFEDVLEVVREDKLLDSGIKLVYLLAGRADAHLSPSVVQMSLEKLLDGLVKINPKVMLVLGGILKVPSDTLETQKNVGDINVRLAHLASKDPHYLYFDPNLSVCLAGMPQKRFFDKMQRVNRAGCRFIAQALVGASKGAQMLQNYNSLPPFPTV